MQEGEILTLEIEFEICEKISYAMYHNNLPVVSKFVLVNEGESVENIVIKVSSDSSFFKTFEIRADRIAARSTIDLLSDPTFKFSLDPNFFANLTENTHGEVNIELSFGEDNVLSHSFSVELQTYDMWSGLGIMPEMIASFVTPNADSLNVVKARASDILKEWGYASSFNGYLSDNDTVLKMVAAIYKAVCEQNINYSLPPNDFGQKGQRIRMPDEVLNTKTGTCIDLAVLFASLFESINLEPVIFFTTGHAFVGVHLVNEAIHSMIEFSNTLYRADIVGNSMCAIECTLAVNSNLSSFDIAKQKGYDNLSDSDTFQLAVEIYNARQKIKPLPIRRMEGTSWIVERDAAVADMAAPKQLGHVDVAMDYDIKLTKVEKWKRQLLDLSTRNYLIKMSLGKKIVPLLISDIASMEDRLSDGKTFTLMSKPQEWGGNQRYMAAPFETDECLGNCSELFSANLGKGYLHTPLTDLETEKTLRSIIRQANQDLEESGCNSLFLVIGVLKWYEAKSKSPNYAPLILLPIQMKKTIKGFVIEKLDEDTLFNVTLQEKLKQEYDIDLPIPDPLPTDDNGVDVPAIIQTVRQAIKKMSGWEVYNGSGLGIFSFSQYAMWKDLDSNIDYFKENPVVRCLAESMPYPAEHIEEDADPYKGCLVVPADGSQVKAINASLNHSFVMHGPPGTGKSQTITNMIANALDHGKTVLFVAEKRAALEVVKNRLDKVGIGNYCLELHSNKAVKSEFISQLKNAFGSVEKYDENELSAMKARLERAKESLDKYAKELHCPMVAGRSMYSLISSFEDNDVEDVIDIHYLGAVENHTEEMIESIEACVSEAFVLGEKVGSVSQEDLDLIGLSEPSLTIETETIEHIQALEDALKQLTVSNDKLNGIKLPYSLTEFEKIELFFDKLGTISRKLITDPDAEKYLQDIDELNNGLRTISDRLHAISITWQNTSLGDISVLSSIVSNTREKYQKFISRGYLETNASIVNLLDSADTVCQIFPLMINDLKIIGTYWNNEIFKDNGVATLYQRYDAANHAGFLKKGGERRAFLASVSSYLLNSNQKYEAYEASIKLIVKDAPDIARCYSAFSNAMAPVGILAELQENICTLIDLKKELSVSQSELLEYYDIIDTGKALISEYKEKYSAWKDCYESLSQLLEMDLVLPIYPALFEETEELCERLRAISESIYDIVNWHDAEKHLEAAGLSELTTHVLEGADEEVLIHSAYRAFFKACLDYCRRTLEGMRTFGPVAFERSIRQFKEYDKKYTELNRNILKCHLFMNLPNNEHSVSGTETYTLNKAIQSTRMRLSIRSLMSQIPNVLQKVCPCFLMSPLSVSQYLSKDFPKFDLVIFDESSQITTPKAICALGRAKNAIIAGDNKQLPPTSFFQKKIEGDDEEDMIDVDSFLDDCLALNMPETYLEWHYRSHHESLIAFSNRMYYGGKMLTFPSSNDGETEVSEVKVEKGLYERGSGRNYPEAEAVVNEIYHRVMDDKLSKMSIGVIAFSTRQQGCIQDMLDDRAGKDPVFFDRLNAMPEGVFVKNLETVQGDERDVILFSIGYGRSKDGTVYQNFGPLNQAGGGRRLNVAVSRARCKMIVFASMNFTDVKITPTTGPGVKGMREFLRFAENNGRFEKQDRTIQGKGESSILSSIAAELQANGYLCHFGIGESRFHVDVAVVDKNHPGQYLLGILSDGESYRNSDNTRDREYARAEVLKNFGWNLIHVWSYEWYSNRTEVVNKILERLHAIESGQILEDESVTVDESGPAKRELMSVNVTATASRRREYMPSAIITDPSYVMTTEYPQTIIKKVIDEESPIDEKYLVKIVGKLMGMKKISENGRNTILKNISGSFVSDKCGDFVTYWKDNTPVECDYYRVSKDPTINRKIEWMSLPELRAAVIDTVGAAGSVKRSDAETAVARTLEYNRTGAVIKETIGKVIDMQIEDGKIVLTEDGRLILP